MGLWFWTNPDLPSLQACAVGLIAVGIGAQLVLSQTISQGATPASVLPVVIIAVGAFLFLVAIVGCCGACKENYCLMITVSEAWGQCGCLGLLEGHFCLAVTRVSEMRWGGKNLCECSRDWLGHSWPHTQILNLTPILCSCSLLSSCLLLCWWRWLQPLLAMCLETR